MSPNNWLNFLNLDFEAQSQSTAAAMAPATVTGNSNNNNRNTDAMLSSGFGFAGIGNSPLSDDLKAQLEAWTNVSFGGEDSSSNGNNAGGQGRDLTLDNQNNYFNVLSNEDTKKDPSPYAKRPFGNFSSTYQALERGFDAFASKQDATSTQSTQSTTPAQQQYQAPVAQLTTNTPASNVTTPSSNSNDNWQSSLPVFDFTKSFGPLDTAAYPMLPEFARNLAQQQAQTIQLHNQQKAAALASQSSTPSSTDNAVPPPPSKRQRTNANTSSAASATASPASKGRENTSEVDANNSSDSYIDANGVLVKRQPLLTKAAILAQQLEELKNKQGRTPEEEALRQAELNRIAAEDDKRRRNTAASARFRVKKKQREAALEDTINELKAKVSTIEQELAKTKNENTFLRDLVIRKIGLGDLGVTSPSITIPAPASLQSEAKGVGTLFHN